MIEESMDAPSPSEDATSDGDEEKTDEPTEPSTSYGARKEWQSTRYEASPLVLKEKELPHPPSTEERIDVTP